MEISLKIHQNNLQNCDHWSYSKPYPREGMGSQCAWHSRLWHFRQPWTNNRQWENDLSHSLDLVIVLKVILDPSLIVYHFFHLTSIMPDLPQCRELGIKFIFNSSAQLAFVTFIMFQGCPFPCNTTIIISHDMVIGLWVPLSGYNLI